MSRRMDDQDLAGTEEELTRSSGGGLRKSTAFPVSREFQKVVLFQPFVFVFAMHPIIGRL